MFIHSVKMYTLSCTCVFNKHFFLLLLPYIYFQTYFAFDSRAETEVYLRYGQHPELYPNRRGEIVQGLVYML